MVEEKLGKLIPLKYLQEHIEASPERSNDFSPKTFPITAWEWNSNRRRVTYMFLMEARNL